MINVERKQQAFAEMDHVVGFELHLVSSPPPGEHVVELWRGPHVDDVRPVATFFSRMARTFFAAKLQGRVTNVVGNGPVGFYLVGRLPELGADDMVELMDECIESLDIEPLCVCSTCT